MWLFFALLAPFLFALVHVMDSYCVDEVFEKPWMGMITSAAASIIVYAPIPFILPFIEWQWPALEMMLLSILAGGLIQFSQAFYFQSLGYSEAAIVSSYWNLIPVFVGIISFSLFGNTITGIEFIGIAILIGASTQILLIDSNFEFRFRTLVLMIVASLLQAIAYLTLDHVYHNTSFLTAYMFVTSGLIFFGLLPLLSKKIRKQFVWKATHTTTKRNLFFYIECINLLALASAEKAIQIGNPILVTGVETTIPFFTVIISIFFVHWTKGRHGDSRSKKQLIKKSIAMGLMVLGVIFVA